MSCTSSCSWTLHAFFCPTFTIQIRCREAFCVGFLTSLGVRLNSLSSLGCLKQQV